MQFFALSRRHPVGWGGGDFASVDISIIVGQRKSKLLTIPIVASAAQPLRERAGRRLQYTVMFVTL